MTFDRQISIDTPEGLRMEATLAGVGSRAGAQVVDGLIKAALTLLTMWVFRGFDRADVSGAIVAVMYFVWLIVYELFFELAWRGRTPGKFTMGIQVVDVTGGPAGVSAIVVRNVMRAIDGSLLYVPALISALVTERNQRLGDLAAGTIVVRERTGADHLPRATALEPITLPDGMLVGAIDDKLVAAARAFLARRDTLEKGARFRVARTLADQLRGAVTAPGVNLGDERIIEIVADVASRRR